MGNTVDIHKQWQCGYLDVLIGSTRESHTVRIVPEKVTSRKYLVGRYTVVWWCLASERWREQRLLDHELFRTGYVIQSKKGDSLRLCNVNTGLKNISTYVAIEGIWSFRVAGGDSTVSCIRNTAFMIFVCEYIRTYVPTYQRNYEHTDTYIYMYRNFATWTVWWWLHIRIHMQ